MELREAIAVEPCQPSSQQDKLVNDVYQLVPWCGNLLALDEEEGLVQFAHHSVKDYLLSGKVLETSSHPFHIKLQDVEQEVGEICCTYLNFSDFEREIIHFPQAPSGIDPNTIVETSLSASSSPTMTSSLLKLNKLRKARRATENSAPWRQLRLTSLKVATMWPQNLQTRYYFLAYASEYWLHHTSKFKEKNQCWNLFRRFVVTEKTTLATRPWSMEEWKAFGAKVQGFILKTEHHALLRLANLEQLIHPRADLFRVITHRHSPWCSDEDFQFHINATILVEDFWSTWDPVLIIAAERQRLDSVKQVLKLAGGFESLAQHEAKFKPALLAHMDTSLAERWKSALERAEGQMLDLLLTYKAIMLGKLKERGYEELYRAACEGDLRLTGRLLDAHVDPNVVPLTQSPSFNSILAAAVSGESLEVVELLLRAGAEANPRTLGLVETPLGAAAKEGRMLVIIALLAAGADVNAHFGDGSLTPLAAVAGHEDVMVLLLLAGAHFKCLASCYQLHDCCYLGRYDSIKKAKLLASSLCDVENIRMVDHDEGYSSFPPKDRQFFSDLRMHVRSSCGFNMNPIKVKKAIAAFLYWRTSELGKFLFDDERSKRRFLPEHTASEKGLYELYIDELQRGAP